MARILAIRFSALGDVAMTVSVLKAFADAYPKDEITLLSRGMVAPLVEHLPKNVKFRPVNLNDYKGLGGLRRLSHELMGEGYDMVADWHDVLRSKVLRYFFRLNGRPVAYIDKDRRSRRLLTRAQGKVRVAIKGSSWRYADVLESLGFPVELKPYNIFEDQEAEIEDLRPIVGNENSSAWVGIAPFAAHEGKIYPLDKMREAIALLGEIKDIKIFLFGNGKSEKAWCESVESEQDNVVSMIGKTNLRKELRLMAHLRVMVTMDSANMHLSSLVGTPTLSIWGATHPLAGFAGMQSDGSRILQTEMECRPCSIFGNKKCLYGDYRCLNSIDPREVADAILQYCHSRK